MSPFPVCRLRLFRTMSGCKLSGRASEIYYDMFIKAPSEVPIFQHDKLKKKLWQGEYQVIK